MKLSMNIIKRTVEKKLEIIALLAFILVALFIALPAMASVNQEWTAGYNGLGNSNDYARMVKVDASGNSYVTGASPGSGTGLDYVTIKYDPNGNQLWARRYNGPLSSTDSPLDMKIDRDGNVYVTGKSMGTGWDYVTIKYDTSGNQLWIAKYNGVEYSDDDASSLDIDNTGNVYVTGYSGPFYNITTVKYNANGTILWVSSHVGGWTGNYRPSLSVDASGNVYVGAASNAISGNFDYLTVKYDTNGNQIWDAYYNGPSNSFDDIASIAVDTSGNAYVTGRSRGISSYSDITTIKYDTNGNRLWVARYDVPDYSDDLASSITLDPSGNVYVTGDRQNEIVTIKYDTNGNQIWVANYPRIIYSLWDYLSKIAIDSGNNVYVTTADRSSGNYDYVTLKYNNSGIQQWVKRYNGTANGNDGANAIAVGSDWSVFVAGSSEGSGTGFDITTIKYNQTESNEYPMSIDMNIIKFEDLNADGTRNQGEHALPDWNFSVKDKNNNEVCAGTTDATGNFTCWINASFRPPPYTITEGLKPGWNTTTPNPLTIFPLYSPVNISFGNIITGVIRGTKWNDLNGNGIRDWNEPGMANVEICYSGGAGFGCVFTDESGSFSLVNLTAGDYNVNEVLPAGMIQTFPLDSLFNNNRSSYSFTLHSGEIKNGIDFGNTNASEIHGMKFNDSNGNGVRDSGEQGVSDVEIQLTRMVAPGREFVLDQTYTDSSGDYNFTGLSAGFYKVEEFPIDSVQTFPANGEPHFINLSPGEVKTGVDFGNKYGFPGEIHGTKFNDSNGNGIQDTGEAGVEGVSICISPLWDCTATNSFGNYSFQRLPPGNYVVYEILPFGRVATTPMTVIVTVNSSEIKTVNFGNRFSVPPPDDISVAQQSGTQNGVPTVFRPNLSVLTIRKNLSNYNDVLSVNLTLNWSDGTVRMANMVQTNATGVWMVNFNAPFPAGTAQMTFEVDRNPSGPSGLDFIEIGDIIFIDPSGRVIDACTRAPISGANATLLVEYPPGTGNFTISPPENQIPDDNPQITGEDGKYSWLTVPGTYKVRADFPGYVTTESNPVDVPPPATNLDISLTPIGVCVLPSVRYINGTVMDSITKEVLPGVTVSTTGASTTSDMYGFYSLEVASGTYPLMTMYDIRYYTNSSVMVSTEFSAVTEQDIELVRKPTGNITGMVTKTY